MSSPDPWADSPAPADPDVKWGPTIYAQDPQAVVDFLTGDYPYHLTHDAGAWADDDDDDDC